MKLLQSIRKFLAVTLFLLFTPAALAIQLVDDQYLIAQGDFGSFQVFDNDAIDFGSFESPTVDDVEIISGDALITGFSIEGVEVQPDSGFEGIIELEYSATDDSGTDQASVIIEVQASPATHQALDDAFYLPENSDVANFRVDANDRYVFDNNVQITDLSTSAEGVTPTINDGLVSYQAPADFTGVDTFSYTLTDLTTGETDDAEVTVYIGLDPDLELSGRVPGLSAEEQQVYDIIVQVCNNDPNTDIPCGDINDLSEGETKTLVQQASGRQARLQSRAMRQIRSRQSDNLRTRLSEVRSGQNRVSVNGLNASLFGKSVPLASALQTELNEGMQGGSAGDSDIATPWGVFVNGNLSLGEADERNGRPDYDQDGYNLTMGVDYRFSDSLVGGVAAGFSRSDLDFSRDMGEQASDSYSLSLFGNYYPADNIYIDGLLMLVNGGLDTERQISVGAISEQLESDTDTQQVVVSTSAGYEFSWQRWQASVYGRLEYSDLTIDGYRESGGGGFALAVAEQDTSSFDSALGTRLGYVFNLSRGVVVPNVELEYVRQDDDEYSIESRFLNSPLAPQFSLSAEEQDTEYVNFSTSISAVFSGGRSGFFRYETMLLQDDFDMSTYSLGFRMEF